MSNRIAVNPAECHGSPFIRGSNVLVKDVLASLAEGGTEDEILRSFPQLQREDIRAALAWVAKYLDDTLVGGSLGAAYARYLNDIDANEIGRLKSRIEQLRSHFGDSWRRIYDEEKQNRDHSEEILERILLSHSDVLAMIFAVARRDEIELFRPIKKLIEYMLEASNGLGGYASILAIPHAAAGFYYSTLTTLALDSESWKVLRECLNVRFEWSDGRSQPVFSFGFDLPRFFHSDVFGRDAAKCHDFFRGFLMKEELLKTLNRTSEDLLNSYVQAQFLMCLRTAKERQAGALDARIWADFGRFHDYRVSRLLDRAYLDAEVGDGIVSSFDESSRETFFTELNSRLELIRSTFWGSTAGYRYHSIGQWAPAHV